MRRFVIAAVLLAAPLLASAQIFGRFGAGIYTVAPTTHEAIPFVSTRVPTTLAAADPDHSHLYLSDGHALFDVDIVTRAVTERALSAAIATEDLVFDRHSGRLYGFDWHTCRVLVIDPASGQVTSFTVDGCIQSRLMIDDDAQELFLYTLGRQVTTIDLLTHSSRTVAVSGEVPTPAAFDRVSKRIIGPASLRDDEFVATDPRTGTATSIGMVDLTHTAVSTFRRLPEPHLVIDPVSRLAVLSGSADDRYDEGSSATIVLFDLGSGQGTAYDRQLVYEVIAVFPGSALPALSPWVVAVLALTLATLALRFK